MQLKLKKDNQEKLFILISYGTLAFLALGTFIATSWYSVDYKIADALDNGLKNPFLSFFALYVEIAGLTMVFSVAMILASILAESLLVKFKEKWSFFRNNKWFIWVIYFIFLMMWIIYNYKEAYEKPFNNYGIGVGIDNELILPISYKIAVFVVSIFIETTIMVTGILLVHFKLAKQQYFMENEYWKSAIAAFLFFILSSIVTLFILKPGFGREYFYSVNAEGVLKDLKAQHPELFERYMRQNSQGFGMRVNCKEAQKEFEIIFGKGTWKEDYINLNFKNVPGNWAWWSTNGFFGKSDHGVDLSKISYPYQEAFPSGHINSSYCYVALTMVFVNKKYDNNNKTKRYVKAAIVLSTCFVAFFNIFLVVGRTHWMSDTTFTTVWALIAMSLSWLIVNSSVKNIKQIIKWNRIKKSAYLDWNLQSKYK